MIDNEQMREVFALRAELARVTAERDALRAVAERARGLVDELDAPLVDEVGGFVPPAPIDRVTVALARCAVEDCACNCRWGQHGGRNCSHVRAVRLAWQLRRAAVAAARAAAEAEPADVAAVAQNGAAA